MGWPVVDYAESRGTQLDALLGAAYGLPARVRLILLARSAGEWRTELAARLTAPKLVAAAAAVRSVAGASARP